MAVIEALDAIRDIRVIRSYTDQSISAEDLAAIADTGRKAGSSKNTQRWEFVTVRDRETLAELGRAGRYASHVPSAGAVIALVIPKPDGEHARSVLWDLGRAAQNIMLAAWAMGIGSCPITVHDYGLVARTLGLPADRQCEYLISLGWPADPTELTRAPRAGGRRPHDDVIHNERW